MNLLPMQGCKLFARTLEFRAQTINGHKRNPVPCRGFRFIRSKPKQREFDTDTIAKKNVQNPLVPPAFCKVWNKISSGDLHCLFCSKLCRMLVGPMDSGRSSLQWYRYRTRVALASNV